MTDYLTPQQILFIHYRLIETTGGSHGIRDIGALQSAAARPQTTFGGKELYPGLFKKAGALFESLAGNHPFIDGNKRTAVAASALFLRRNGFFLETTQEDLYSFTMKMATGEAGAREAAEWLEEKSRPLPN
ncbi:MAG TPA: type II toxin-antitoxin system death-on-curing family toxin [Desulfuromonadaceae bacterium]